MSPSFDLGFRADYFISLAGGEVGVERDRFLGIRGDRIAAVEAFRPELASVSKEFHDLSGRVLLPGLINAHTHLPMTLLRGIEDDVELHQWLFHRIFPLEARFMNAENIALGTRLAALECARFGVTTVNDMYFHTGAEMETWERSGLRGVFSQTFIDFPTPEDAEVPKKGESFRALWDRYSKNTRVRVGLGPHAPYSCSDATIAEVVRIQKETGAQVQIHLHETRKEVADGEASGQGRPTERLDRLGLFDARPVLHHGVHLNESDIALLARRKASVVFNPDSNMKLGSGVAPVRELLDGGVNVAIGTDGTASGNSLCLLSAMNIGAKLLKIHAQRTDVIRASEMLTLATWGGAKALGWESEIGSLEVGKRADLIAVDLEQPHLQPVNDVISHLVFSARGQDVDFTVVDGKVLMKNRMLQLPWSLSDLRPSLEGLRSQIRKAIEDLRKQFP